MLFIATVILITLAVILFRVNYITLSNFNRRFHLTLFSFVLSMLILIISPNIIRLLLGWDGLGISSYILVVFYRRRKSLRAGLITGIMNRVGDRLILISLFALNRVSNLRSFLSRSIMLKRSLMGWFFFILARITKSAQIPFRSWLPAAIAAPTPVSALVHSSTLVTAGLYLAIRFSALSIKNCFLPLLSSLGVITILLARIRAIVECDIKKIVALSTLSQLGVMFRAFRTTLISLVFFHLVVHAFFKALLFICAGQTIHNINDSQDLRKIGMHNSSCPIRSTVICLCKASLCGLPFYSSFYSKEMILEGLSTNRNAGILTFFGIWLGVILTLVYSLRFVFLVLIIQYRGIRIFQKQEKTTLTIASIILLFLPRITAGKLIHFFFRVQLGATLESSSTKRIIFLLFFVAFFFTIISINLFHKKPNLGYIWSLARWTGALPGSSFRGLGTHLQWLRRFALGDFLVAWGQGVSEQLRQFNFHRVSFFRIILRLIILLLALKINFW